MTAAHPDRTEVPDTPPAPRRLRTDQALPARHPLPRPITDKDAQRQQQQ